MLSPLIPGADGSLRVCSLPQYAMARAVGAPTLAQLAAPHSVLQDGWPRASPCLHQVPFT